MTRGKVGSFSRRRQSCRDRTEISTPSRLRFLQVALPPLDLQHRFAAIVESVERQKAASATHLAELDTLFASLQSRAFRGDL